MSAQAGIFYFDRRPVPQDVMTALTAACRPYGPDGGSHVCPSPGVALIHHALRITPEDDVDRQPVQCADGKVLTWDGRLDNRVDVMMALGLAPSRGTPDSQVVAEACQRWGDAVFERLYGDWSLTIWDPQQRHITLACDFMAQRGLYYVTTDSYCAWCTALVGLVELTGRWTDFDEDVLQGAVMPMRIPGRTPYRGLRSLFGGHFLRINEDGTSSNTPYWRLPADEIRYRDPRDYAVHFRTVFREAITQRMRTSRPVWMDLSGGWDSSSIVCMAARVLADGGAAAPSLMTVSYTTPRSREGDETPFMDEVSAHTGLAGIKIPMEHDAPPNFPVPEHVIDMNHAVMQAYEQMHRAGARVLLGGGLGDAIMGNFELDITSIAWSIRSARPFALARALRAWGLGSQRTAWELVWKAISELLPTRMTVARLWKDALGPQRSSGNVPLFMDLCPNNERGFALFRATQQALENWCVENERPYVSRRFLRAVGNGLLTGQFTYYPHAKDLTVSQIYLDRRVIEYIGSIPWSVVCEPGRPRALMRDALGPILPDRISRRFSKGYAAPYFARRATALAAMLSEGYRPPLVVERGYVDGRRLTERLEQSQAGPSVTSSGLVLAGVLEAWLRQALEGRSLAA